MARAGEALLLSPGRCGIIRSMAEEIPEFENHGIETIARGVCVSEGHVLLCRPKNGGYTYLPGGHIEFGEKGAEALVREVKEEMGLDSRAGEIVGVVESQFVQRGKKHAEISLVYDLEIDGLPPPGSQVPAKEDWIEFVWWPIDRLSYAGILPAEMARYVVRS